MPENTGNDSGLQPAPARLSPWHERDAPPVTDPNPGPVVPHITVGDHMRHRIAKWLEARMGANWRSTLLGYVVAAGQLAWDSYKSGGVTLQGAVVSAVIAVAGLIVKDAKVTGIGADATAVPALAIGNVPGPEGPEGPRGPKGAAGKR